MQNDRDEKYEGQEESEYHFSDEEVNYEVEPGSTEEPIAGPAKETSAPVTKTTAQGIPRSKMLLSLGIFLVLFMVVYKMVAPSSQTPSTDITPAAPVATATKTMAPVANTKMPAQPTTMAAKAMPAMAPAVTAQSPAPQAVAPAQMQAAATVNMPSPVATPAQTAAPSTTQQMPASDLASMPSMIPVQPTMPTVPSQVNVQQGQAVTVGQPAIDAKLAALAAENDKKVDQLQTEYSQKLSNYQIQNKALEEQLQTLSIRITTLESQLNQLMQVLSRTQSANAPAPAAVQPGQSLMSPPPPLPSTVEQIKTSLNVQAIIPGRAWLKSENGETLTVAEGDSIKDFGRVTKIDPYDGVVEINTGNKIISLSYGTGG